MWRRRARKFILADEQPALNQSVGYNRSGLFDLSTPVLPDAEPDRAEPAARAAGSASVGCVQALCQFLTDYFGVFVV